VRVCQTGDGNAARFLNDCLFLLSQTGSRAGDWGTGSFDLPPSRFPALPVLVELSMNNIIYIVGLVVVVIAILSFFGLG
jgi:hypothetical protein